MSAAALPAGVEAAEVATSRLRTNVLRAGLASAPVLVLVHGNVSSARFFAGTMAVLGQRYHCVAPDLRGFGGTRDLAGTPCWPDYAGSGGGTASPEMVRRIAAGDTGTDDPTSPRNVLTGLYVKPPVQFPPGVEDALVGEMLAMALGDSNYPGDQVASANWPGTGPGRRGVNNAISPKFCDLSGFAGVPDRPDVLWLRGDSDQIVSDTSLVDLGHLGALGAIPGWPGPDVFPAQPMIGQVRAVLDRYRAAGGQYAEHVLPNCGHSPHLEHPAAFESVVAAFLDVHR